MNSSQEVFKIVINELVTKMKSNKIIPLLIDKQQSFENWLQLEIAHILIEKKFEVESLETKINNNNVSGSIDITGNTFAIELKVIKTGWSSFIAKDDYTPKDFLKLSSSSKKSNFFIYFYFPDLRKKTLEKEKQYVDEKMNEIEKSNKKIISDKEKRELKIEGRTVFAGVIKIENKSHA